MGRDLVEQELRIQFVLGDLPLRLVPESRGEGVDRGVFRILSRYAARRPALPKLHKSGSITSKPLLPDEKTATPPWWNSPSALK